MPNVCGLPVSLAEFTFCLRHPKHDGRCDDAVSALGTGNPDEEGAAVMPETKWTPEPWHCRSGKMPRSLYVIVDGREYGFARFYSSDWGVPIPGADHAPQRAADCVNAMEGIPDPLSFVENVERLKRAAESLVSKRFENEVHANHAIERVKDALARFKE